MLLLFLGFAAVVPVFAPAQKRLDSQFGASEGSSQHFSNLTADEINRRTLKAAAAIKAMGKTPSLAAMH